VLYYKPATLRRRRTGYGLGHFAARAQARSRQLGLGGSVGRHQTRWPGGPELSFGGGVDGVREWRVPGAYNTNTTHLHVCYIGLGRVSVGGGFVPPPPVSLLPRLGLVWRRSLIPMACARKRVCAGLAWHIRDF